jgi:hypothetical protein
MMNSVINQFSVLPRENRQPSAVDRSVPLRSDREDAFLVVVERGSLSTLQRYRNDVGDVDPEAYFEAYRELLVPFFVNNTGRNHYRGHLTHEDRMGPRTRRRVRDARRPLAREALAPPGVSLRVGEGRILRLTVTMLETSHPVFSKTCQHSQKVLLLGGRTAEYDAGR